tara:strand:+ start:5297 stop:6409 length:1113 start_codon:yes stop_codon:yes gene_type:complete
MAYEHKILRITDNISEDLFGATSKNFEIIIKSCIPTEKDDQSNTIKQLLARANQGFSGLFLKIGSPPLVEHPTLGFQDGELGFSTYQGPAILRSITIQRIDATAHVYSIKGVISGYGPNDGNDNAPIRVSMDSAGRSAPSYRSNPIIPNQASEAPTATGVFQEADWETTSGGLLGTDGTDPKSETYRPAGDIGGNKIDWNGQPIPQVVPQTRITIEVIRRLPYWARVAGGGSGSMQLQETKIPNSNGDAFCAGSLWTPIGARNEKGLLGFDRGVLRWESTSMTALEDEYSICRFVLLADYWKHATQIPRPTYFTDIGAMTTGGDPRNIKHYIGVYWSQPHLDSFELGDWFFPGEIAYLTKLSDDCGQTWP